MSSKGNILTHGEHQDFGSMANKHSYRSEAYVVLFVFVFLSE